LKIIQYMGRYFSVISRQPNTMVFNQFRGLQCTLPTRTRLWDTRNSYRILVANLLAFGHLEHPDRHGRATSKEDYGDGRLVEEAHNLSQFLIYVSDTLNLQVCSHSLLVNSRTVTAFLYLNTELISVLIVALHPSTCATAQIGPLPPLSSASIVPSEASVEVLVTMKFYSVRLLASRPTSVNFEGYDILLGFTPLAKGSSFKALESSCALPLDHHEEVESLCLLAEPAG
jgi:hypothetical protein